MERHTTSLTVSAQLFLVNRKFHIEIVRDQSKRGPYTRLELHSCLLHDAECNLLATAEFLVPAIMHRTYITTTTLVIQANKVAVAHTLEDMPKLHVIDVTSYGTRAPSPPRSLQMDTNLVVSYSFYLRITPVGSGRTSHMFCCSHRFTAA